MSRVVLERVTKVFSRPGGRSVHALRDFSLSVEDKELLVLVGPSGCGKTTALRLIAGLDEASSGTITMDGRVMNGIPPQARDLAMVFQQHALYPHMTVRGNLIFGLKLRKVPRAEIEQRVGETAEFLGLAALLDALPENLSGGERQRVAVGRALVRKPKVLLFDEPFSQLDAPLRTQMRLELVRLREQLAATIIYVTHDQAEALTLGDRVAVMNEGALQQIDKPRRVYREPENVFVAGFMGSPPMNLFRGTLVASDGQCFFQEQNSLGAAGFLVPVEATHAARLELCVGQRVVLAVRPEHIGATDHPSTSATEIGAVIRLLEWTGSEAWLHGDTGMHLFACRRPGTNTPRVGEAMRVCLDMTNACYFDLATQQRIA